MYRQGLTAHITDSHFHHHPVCMSASGDYPRFKHADVLMASWLLLAVMEMSIFPSPSYTLLFSPAALGDKS